MIHFKEVRVDQILRETPQAVSIILDISDSDPAYKFFAGQHLGFRITMNGEEVRRTYSLSSAPYEQFHKVTVKEVEGGIFSTFANQKLKSGDIVEITPPEGSFYLKPEPGLARNYLAFAAGSGITPVISIIKTALKEEPDSTFTLFYGNQSGNTIIFKEELEALKNLYMDRFQLNHILSRERTDAPLFHGRITAKKCELIFKAMLQRQQFDRVFLCGPSEMIFELRDCLPNYGIDPEQIKFELFTPPGESGSGASRKVQHNQRESCTLKLRLDGNIHKLEVSYNDSILDSAIDRGIDLPYSCKGGVCSTCRAKLLEGQVEMETNYALEKDELAQGYILTCQSFPNAKLIQVDYDAI